MKTLWKYLVPIILVIWGSCFLLFETKSPVSRTLLVAFGNHDKLLGLLFIAVGLFLGALIFFGKHAK